MFIRKITKVSALGRFRTSKIRGGEYSKFTAFYGGNGRGKTTLCAALRSFHLNEPKHLLERTSFGSNAGPEVHLLLNGGTANFTGGQWSASNADLKIFDAHFVSENVHDGESVDTEHRRNFYRVVVGEKGVALAQALDALDEQIAKHNAEILQAKKLLQPHVPSGWALEQFMALPKHPDIDTAIAAAAARHSAATTAAAVANTPLLTAIELPALPPEFSNVLKKSLPDVSKDAQRLVEAHVATHAFQGDGEQWLLEGQTARQGSTCPFCGSDVSTNSLVEAFGVYFGEAYRNLKAEISVLNANVDDSLSSAAALQVLQELKALEDHIAFWRVYTNLAFTLPPEVAELSTTLADLRVQSLALTSRKQQAPLEAVALTAEWIAASNEWERVSTALSESLASLPSLNDMIREVKARTAASDEASTLRELRRLEAIRQRHQPAATALCDHIASNEQAKADCVDKKEKTKAVLDAYDASVLKEYEKSINSFLATFGASFRLTGSSKNYVGKAPQSVFGIQFDGHTVNVAAKDSADGPTFRTALSAGDKNTLALAFFFAQLERDAQIAKRVIVFDDPFTSLDDFRREMTAKEIVRWGSAASQVLVFSHDKHFLDAVRKKCLTQPFTSFQISVTAKDACIEPYDLEAEVKEGYLADHAELAAYAYESSQDARKAVVLMRPLLEKYIRYRFPNAIAAGKWLGDMLEIIRDDPDHPLKPVYPQIDEINAYTAPFHHDPNTPLNPDEVRTFAKKTLGIVGGS